MNNIKPKQGQCKDCKEINPHCLPKYLMAGRCIVGPDFHYQKHQDREYKEKNRTKQVNRLPKSISVRKKSRNTSEKSLPALQKLAQAVFNEYIRKRDSTEGRFVCISCGQTKGTEQMNAGHFYSAGNHSYLRFNENNVHGQCIKCNCYLHGNLLPYRINILKKIGELELNKLDMFKNVSQKWNRVQLLALIELYRTKINSTNFDDVFFYD